MYDITPQINESGGNAMRGLQLRTIHFLGYLRKLAGAHHDFHGPRVLLIFLYLFLHINVLKIILFNSIAIFIFSSYFVI